MTFLFCCLNNLCPIPYGNPTDSTEKVVDFLRRDQCYDMITQLVVVNSVFIGPLGIKIFDLSLFWVSVRVFLDETDI